MAEQPASQTEPQAAENLQPISIRSAFEELKATKKLPSPQGVALEIMRLSAKPDTNLQDVTNLIQLDPALTGRLIEFANSVHSMARRPVVAVSDAAALLGMSTVRQFTLSLSVIQSNLSGACREFNYLGFWTDALARALTAQAITMRERIVPPEEAFTSALLSEIGKLALASVYPEEYARCLIDLRGAGKAEDAGLAASERERFAIDHRQMTLGLLREWGFPDVMLEAVLLQYSPDQAARPAFKRAERFACQLRLASLLGHFCGAAHEERAKLLPRITQRAQLLGIGDNDLAELWNQVSREWRASSRLLSIPPREIPALSGETLPPDRAAEPDSARTGFKILMLMDNADEALRLEVLLTAQGHQVVTAQNCDDGLQRIISDKPELILIGDGYAPAMALPLCRNLRAAELAQSAYMILLTRSADDELHIQALENGIDDVLALPVSDRMLCARIGGGRRLIQLHADKLAEQRKLARYINEIAIAKRKLESMAMTDMLTSLPNRRYAFARLHEEWASWRRTRRPLTVMIADLDYFKQVNDQLGHIVGDQVLVHAAKVIRTLLRATDAACRLGGEEFVIIAPNTDRLAAEKLAERLRHDVEIEQCAAKLPRPLTISVGVAVSDERAGNESDLLHHADLALYRAKHSGRNNVQVY